MSVPFRWGTYVLESGALLDERRTAVGEVLTARDPREPVDRETIAAQVRLTARQFINQRFQRKPVVLPMVLTV